MQALKPPKLKHLIIKAAKHYICHDKPGDNQHLTLLFPAAQWSGAINSSLSDCFGFSISDHYCLGSFSPILSGKYAGRKKQV